MASCGALGSSPSPAIAHRSCVQRRPEACVDGGVDLAHKKAQYDVQELCEKKRKQEGEEKGARDRRSTAGGEIYRRRVQRRLELEHGKPGGGMLGFLGQNDAEEMGFK